MLAALNTTTADPTNNTMPRNAHTSSIHARICVMVGLTLGLQSAVLVFQRLCLNAGFVESML